MSFQHKPMNAQKKKKEEERKKKKLQPSFCCCRKQRQDLLLWLRVVCPPVFLGFTPTPSPALLLQTGIQLLCALFIVPLDGAVRMNIQELRADDGIKSGFTFRRHQRTKTKMSLIKPEVNAHCRPVHALVEKRQQRQFYIN